VPGEDDREGLQHLAHCLMELVLAGIATQDVLVDPSITVDASLLTGPLPSETARTLRAEERGAPDGSPPCESGAVPPTPEYAVLEYTLADDYLERRAALRDEHLALARAAHDRGELLFAGALPDPFDRALLIWTAPRDVVERFAEQDPYVVQGLVTSWTVRPWNVVVGG
jgi:uncharacterized protein YciI